MPRPAAPKIYHIVHVDRLPSILDQGGLLSDAEVVNRRLPGSTIGMSRIKQRRLHELFLSSHRGLRVGACVPFYFCPRSVMLHVIHKANHPDLAYRGGQGPIVHLEADLGRTVEWAGSAGRRWAFTLSNAGAYYFEDRAELSQLDEVDWEAVEARDWQQRKEGKQAEFLVETHFPWELVERIGVHNVPIARQVQACLAASDHRPPVEVLGDWYYGRAGHDDRIPNR